MNTPLKCVSALTKISQVNGNTFEGSLYSFVSEGILNVLGAKMRSHRYAVKLLYYLVSQECERHAASRLVHLIPVNSIDTCRSRPLLTGTLCGLHKMFFTFFAGTPNLATAAKMQLH